LAPGGYAAAMPLSNLSASCQPDPGSIIFSAALQPLKNPENPIRMPFVKADAVVLNRNSAKLLASQTRRLAFVILLGQVIDSHDWRPPGYAEFDRVADQVLHQHSQLQRIAMYRRQIVDLDLSPGLFDSRFKVG
jgi:hypothetical protein